MDATPKFKDFHLKTCPMYGSRSMLNTTNIDPISIEYTKCRALTESLLQLAIVLEFKVENPVWQFLLPVWIFCQCSVFGKQV